VCVEAVIRVRLVRELRRLRDLDEAAFRVQARRTVVPPLHGQHNTRAPVLARPAEHVLDEFYRSFAERGRHVEAQARVSSTKRIVSLALASPRASSLICGSVLSPGVDSGITATP
jgi:transposase InsO family protein